MTRTVKQKKTNRRSRRRSGKVARPSGPDKASGLLSEVQFAHAVGLGMRTVRAARMKGLIEPKRSAWVGSRPRYFYHPRQVRELREKLGITLDDTTGLLSEAAFRRLPGFWKIHKYRERGLIKPVGWAMGHTGLSAFYHPKQAQELRRKLGTTLKDTTGLLSDPEVKKMPGLSGIHAYRKRGLIRPVGYALNGNYVSAFYRPEQIKELQRRLGVMPPDTAELLDEKEFGRASGIRGIGELRRKGVIKPACYGRRDGSRRRAFYRPEQVRELKRKLGITLEDTTGLFTEKEFARVSGLTAIHIYRKKGLIQPVGRARNKHLPTFFYRWEQIAELKRKLGFTLEDADGLLSENQVAKLPGLGKIGVYRKEGLIEPLGYAFCGRGGPLAALYHPLQLDGLQHRVELRKKQRKAEKQRIGPVPSPDPNQILSPRPS